MPANFSPAAVRFFKSLKRNNNRDWFNERKQVYEQEVKAPFLALIEQVNHSLADFAPEYIKPAPKAIFRIYRDTRFSGDKRPYKTHAGAWWSPSAFAKTSGAGFYMHIGADDVVIAAGNFMPPPDQLLLIRRYLEMHHAEMRALLTDKKLRRLLPDLETNPLKRMPKGFPSASLSMQDADNESPTGSPLDHPAAEYLLDRKWGISVTLPADTAASPKFFNEIVTRFRAATPLVNLLNTPLAPAKTSRKSLF